MVRPKNKRAQRLASLSAVGGAIAFVLVACAETREPEVPAGPPPKPCSSQKECGKGLCVMDPCVVSPCTVGHCKD